MLYTPTNHPVSMSDPVFPNTRHVAVGFVYIALGRLYHGYFSMNLENILGTPFLQDTFGRLLQIFRTLDIQIFNSKQICSLHQYCRHAIIYT